MSKTPLLLTITATLLCLSGCAAKNRWFSRKDYNDLQDPFMESDSLAEAKDADKDAPSGKARMDTLTAGTDMRPADPAGEAAIRKAAGQSDGVARIGRVAPASYPDESSTSTDSSAKGVRSYSGPALSDFLSRARTTGAAASTEAESLPNKAASADSAARTALASDSTTRTGRPAAAAVAPNLSAEAEGFHSFLQEKSEIVSSASQQAAGLAEETGAAADDFASWATQQKAEWSQKGAETKEAISQAPAAATQQMKSAAQQARKMADDAIFDFNASAAGSFEPDEDEAAEPLMNRYAAPKKSDFAEVPKSAARVPAESDFENPFDNPFADDDNNAAPSPDFGAAGKSDSVLKGDAAKSSRKSLDDTFQMDSGWKPSQFSRP